MVLRSAGGDIEAGMFLCLMITSTQRADKWVFTLQIIFFLLYCPIAANSTWYASKPRASRALKREARGYEHRYLHPRTLNPLLTHQIRVRTKGSAQSALSKPSDTATRVRTLTLRTWRFLIEKPVTLNLVNGHGLAKSRVGI